VRYLPNRYAETSQTTLTNNTFNIHTGDNQLILPTLPDNSIDSIVTDPPYELGFMGKTWDATGIAYNVEMWRECLRVLKPGGHLLAFSGSRTYHRMAVAIEDAGFQIRDQIMWVYGSGFPKSLNISKAIDKAAGAEQEIVQELKFGRRDGESVTSGASNGGTQGGYNFKDNRSITAPATDEAKQWDGWGTALKPAHEPIVLARKPLDGTVANNVLVHGVGGINIDGCRVGEREVSQSRGAKVTSAVYGKINVASLDDAYPEGLGRFPANFIHDGSDEVLELFPIAGNKWKRNYGVEDYNGKQYDGGSFGGGGYNGQNTYADSGSAARFFYCAKANKKDRNEGLDGFAAKFSPTMNNGIGGKEHDPQTATKKLNHHPTVKPTDLMRYLCRLITPPNGTVLDPFTGSGSTGKAALLEGFNFIGIEQSAKNTLQSPRHG
jgi:DNA modification methylase